jgi:hypothetical protein
MELFVKNVDWGIEQHKLKRIREKGFYMPLAYSLGIRIRSPLTQSGSSDWPDHSFWANRSHSG